jgi:selenocysteine-specific elongation factor
VTERSREDARPRRDRALPDRHRGRTTAPDAQALDQVARSVYVAVNLVGTEREELDRGDVVGRPGDWRPTAELEARVRPVRGLTHPLTARGAYKLHAGSAERDARVRFYGADEVPSEGAFARIRLSAPLVLDVGDRFVLRETGRRETVAGGVVLDIDPPTRPGPDASERLERRAPGPARTSALLVAEAARCARPTSERSPGGPPCPTRSGRGRGG